jgi:fermentation-respiration switch protein FrsA (DUF1100 family)
MSDEPKRRAPRWVRLLRRAGAWIVAAYLCLSLYACTMADRMIFQPQPPSYADSADIIKVEVEDGQRISAVYLPNPDADLTVLYSHGNAEDLGDIAPFLRSLHDHGYSVFAYDYRGYGTSDGKPSEKNAYRDAEAAYAYVTGGLRVPPERVAVHGRSLGGALACYLAAERPVGGLVMQSSFVSAFRVVTQYPLLPFDKFRNLRRIGQVECPVLVMHGTADRVIPEWHGRKLFAAAPEPKLYLPLEGADHNDPVWQRYPEYWQALDRLAEEVRAGAR